MMKIAIGCDHGGLRLKEEIKQYLTEEGVEFCDMGTFTADSVDYPDITVKVTTAVTRGECDRGIMICGTGIGVCIAANKVDGIRAALCHDAFSAQMSREHNDANVLTLGERVIGPGLAKMITGIWLRTEFAGGRHACRVDKIMALENR